MALSAGSSRFAQALTGVHDAPVAFGLSFAPPAVLEALTGFADAARALPVACKALRLDFVFVEPGPLQYVERLTEEGCASLGVVAGPLGRMLEHVGHSQGLLATVRNPDALMPILDGATERAAAELEAMIGSGVDGIVLAEDLAGTAGPLVAPDYAFAEIFPRLRSLVEAAGRAGLPAVLHTDGDARLFAPAAARAGFMALHGGGGLAHAGLQPLIDAVHRAGMAFLGGVLSAELARGMMHAIAGGSVAGVIGLAGGLLVCDDGGLTTARDADAYVSALAAARDAVERGGVGR